MMKKILILCFLLLFTVTTAYAAEKEVFSFRGVEFGMTMEEVRTHATGKLYEESKYHLTYEIEDMYDLKCYIGYWFSGASTKLWQMSLYLFVPSNMDQTIKYAQIKEDLWAKYNGSEEPQKNGSRWRFVNDVTFIQPLSVNTELGIDSEDDLVIIIEFYEGM